MKFKSDIEVQAGLKDSSGAAGTSGQILSSNGTTVSWINSGGDAYSFVKQNYYYSSAYDWNTIGAEDSNTAIALRIESNVINPPSNTIYNWSLWQQGNSTRGSQIAVGAYGGNEIYFRGANNYAGSYRGWQRVLHDGNYSSYAVPTSRTITINGTSYDLSADRSWTVTASETDTLATVTGRGNTTTSNISANGVRIGRNFSLANRATVRLDSNGDYPADVLFGRDVNYADSSWNGVYWSLSSRGSNESNSFRLYRGIANTGTTELVFLDVSTSGSVAAYSDFRAPLFYDANDTAYYVNPASATRLNGYLSFGIPGNGANANGRWLSIEGNTDVDGEGSGRLFFTEHNSTTGAMDSYGLSIGYRGGATSVTTAGGNTWTGLSAIDNGAWGFWGHDGSTTGTLAMYGPRSGAYIAATGDLRAPIFYDLNDTGHYINPASNSRTGGISAIRSGGGHDPYGVISVSAPSAANYSYFGMTRNGIIGLGLGIDTDNYVWIGGTTGGHDATRASTWVRFGSGATIFAGDARATQFYDSNNTAYYTDPASTSTLYDLNIAGQQRFTSQGAKVYFGDNTSASPLCIGEGLIDTFGSDSDFMTLYGRNSIRFFSTGTSEKGRFDNDGFKATIFYDLNDTANYLDPNGTSNLYIMKTSEYRGNANVGGTGEATWHPAGIYCGSTMWQYGDMYKNNSSIYDIYNGFANSSLRAPVFYDNNNTSYYLDPTSVSNLWELQLTGGSNKYLYLNPGTGYEAMLRVQGGSGSSWYAGKRTTSTTQAGTDGFHFYSDAGGDTVVGFGTDGTIKAKGDVVAYSSSDRQLKDNIEPIENALEKVKQIGGYTFNWNDKQDTYKGHDIGVIAQEIEAVLPEVVTTRDTGFKAVKYEKIVPLLIEAIKEQSSIIDKLINRIEKLESK